MSAQVEVRLPELADAMASATLTAWLKQPGDPVTEGEPIAEVETDKTTVELEAPADGVLAEIRVAAGTEAVPVGTVLALVREGALGESEARGAPAGPPPAADSDAPQWPGAAAGAADAPPDPAATVDVTDGAPARAEPSTQADVPATPLARRMAALAGIDLTRATGSGDGGRVTKADVERVLRSSPGRAAAIPAADARAPEPAAAATPTAVPTPEPPHADRPLTAMRRVTAQRMAEAKRSAPHFYLEVECAVDRLLALRDDASPRGGTDAPTVNDVVVRAAALALRQVPLANSAWTGDAVRVYDRVDLAIAVTTPAGLVTPVVRAADAKPLAAIAAELRRLAKDARAGRLQPADYQGGTCTISNLGMYGVTSLYAILNPPQSCILGVGAISERPVVRDGAVTVGSMMKVTLSADHRAIDGATGAELLRALKVLLEDPQRVYG
ncbi:MAG: dihydrolipoamide acetyltransferase family protein, partial [Acidobacteria bacterium]|nr:dihydrolipoamide acetyltransferase family protein [Acidobacteriota bacterium]